MKNTYCLVGFLFFGISAICQTALTGKIQNTETQEALIGADVKVFKESVFISGSKSDFNGLYLIKIDPGSYELEFSYPGYPASSITEVIVKAGQHHIVDVQLGEQELEIIRQGYKTPLPPQAPPTGRIITSEEIRNLPTRNIIAIATTIGCFPTLKKEKISPRNRREEHYYIDGRQYRLCRDSEGEIMAEQNIIIGGTPARCGGSTVINSQLRRGERGAGAHYYIHEIRVQPNSGRVPEQRAGGIMPL